VKREPTADTKRKRGDVFVAQVALRFPRDLFDRLEQYVDRLNRERPGLGITRADVVRVLVRERLDEIEAEEKARK